MICCVCSSPDWIACAPGEVADSADGNLFYLHPKPDVPALAWCLAHWPFLQQPKVKTPMKHVEISIRADIPEGAADDLGHDAIVATKESAHAIVEALHKLGLKNATQTRHIFNRRNKAAVATPVPVATL